MGAFLEIEAVGTDLPHRGLVYQRQNGGIWIIRSVDSGVGNGERPSDHLNNSIPGCLDPEVVFTPRSVLIDNDREVV